MIEADYVVIGAGAMGMAFADAILTETDATVAIVDRYGKPGGHWNRAYPFVRLHQPSAFYGVNSRELSSGRKDTIGGNAGLFELASGAEVLSYFDLVLNQQFLASGRVRYFPLCEYAEGAVISLASGEAHQIRAKKLVDATYMHVNVPSMRPPAYDVADGVRCAPPNALTTLDRTAAGYVVIGAGKTGIDACLWLLSVGVDPNAIRWIMPRDSWLLDRKTIQPGPDFFDNTAGGYSLQLEASALATSIDDLFERLEATGQLLRLDPMVRSTMYRCATVTVAELEELRRIKNVVRMGRVRSIGAKEIVLDNGSIPTSSDVLHVDCTADGLERRPPVPVFAGDRITLQSVRTCQQVLSAAIIAHAEAAYDDEERKNELCTPIPHPDSDIDWLRTTLANTINVTRWAADPGMGAWLANARLNINTAPAGAPTPEQIAIITRIGQHSAGAITNLQELLAGVAA
jgi:hypothetical protein